MKKAILGTLTVVFLVTAGVCLNAWSEPWHHGWGSRGDGGCSFHRHMMEGAMMGPGMGPGFMDHGMIGDDMHLVMMAEKLNLSSEQRDKIGKIMDTAHSQMRDLLFKMVDMHKEVRSLTRGAAKADDAKLRQLADQQGKLTADMMYLCWKSRADMRAVLTPDQLKKLDSYHRERWSGKRSRMDRGMRRGMARPGPGA
jgi:Spy/CpxP family protein refolding chaperone